MDLQTSVQAKITETGSIKSNVMRLLMVRDLMPSDKQEAYSHYLLGYLAASVTSEEMTEALTAASRLSVIQAGRGSRGRIHPQTNRGLLPQGRSKENGDFTI